MTTIFSRKRSNTMNRHLLLLYLLKKKKCKEKLIPKEIQKEKCTEGCPDLNKFINVCFPCDLFKLYYTFKTKNKDILNNKIIKSEGIDITDRIKTIFNLKNKINLKFIEVSDIENIVNFKKSSKSIEIENYILHYILESLFNSIDNGKLKPLELLKDIELENVNIYIRNVFSSSLFSDLIKSL